MLDAMDLLRQRIDVLVYTLDEGDFFDKNSFAPVDFRNNSVL